MTMTMNLRLRESETNLEYQVGNGKNGEAPLTWSALKSPRTESQADHSNAVVKVSTKFRELCRDLFLPIGYPESVAEGYLEYQFYDSLQGLCSYLRGVVATSAVLSATGVGDAEATAMGAAMTWAVRDGLGMIGGLMFSYVASPHFDAHVKEFRLLADVLNDVGMTLDMALPLILEWFSSFSSPSSSISSPTVWQWLSILWGYTPSLYLVLTSTSTLCKVACGMAAGATKGNITDHFAISGNRADCQSKESTQETLVSLVGMCCGIWIAKLLTRLEKFGKDNQDISSCINGEVDNGNGDTCANNDNATVEVDAHFISWIIFIILTLIHVWANYLGMQKLRLRTLNRERAKVALQSLIEDCGMWVLENQKESNGHKPEANGDGSNNQSTETPTSPGITSKTLAICKAKSHLLSPKAVSESLWKSMCGMVCTGNIHLGIRLKDLVLRSSSSKRQNATRKWSCGQWGCENYMIFADEDGVRDHANKRQKSTAHSVMVVLRVGANDRDEFKAFIHAHILNWSMQHHDSHFHTTNLPELLSRSYEMVQDLFQQSSIDGTLADKSPDDAIDLYNVLGEKGWDMTRLYLGFNPHRCQWEEADTGS